MQLSMATFSLQAKFLAPVPLTFLSPYVLLRKEVTAQHICIVGPSLPAVTGSNLLTAGNKIEPITCRSKLFFKFATLLPLGVVGVRKKYSTRVPTD